MGAVPTRSRSLAEIHLRYSCSASPGSSENGSPGAPRDRLRPGPVRTAWPWPPSWPCGAAAASARPPGATWACSFCAASSWPSMTMFFKSVQVSSVAARPPGLLELPRFHGFPRAPAGPGAVRTDQLRLRPLLRARHRPDRARIRPLECRRPRRPVGPRRGPDRSPSCRSSTGPGLPPLQPDGGVLSGPLRRPVPRARRPERRPPPLRQGLVLIAVLGVFCTAAAHTLFIKG